MGGQPTSLLTHPPHAAEADIGAVRQVAIRSSDHVSASVRGLRPAQWIKNGLVFAGLVFGGKLLEPAAVANAVLAAIWFSLLSS
ncbi:MAG: hypothetical protein K0Q71_2276, partial [Thermomicrobiales bacterium]|nr:hypothetical protein [Thermomicrobiales bacterium]